MKRLARNVSLLLLALWLPATLHCDLEAAGLAPESVVCEEAHAPAGHAADNCDLIENGTYKSATAVLKVTAPLLLSCLCCLVEITPETNIVPLLSPERSDSPPELVRTWQFQHRAALPVRAPALNA